MATPIPLSVIEEITSTVVDNASTVTGTTIENALDNLKTTLDNKDGFDYNQAGDPAPDTNPPNGVGSTWINQTSGEIFQCIDATAGSNIWEGTAGTTIENTIIGGQQGSNYSYMGGGFAGSNTNIIDRWAMASASNATDVGDMVYGTNSGGATSSTSHGYFMGGNGTANTNIERFSFAASANGSDVGNLIQGKRKLSCVMDATYGFIMGGDNTNGGDENDISEIERHTFSSSSTNTDVGDMDVGMYASAGISGPTHGYQCGGASGISYGTRYNIIQRFQYTNPAATNDVGDLTDIAVINAGFNGTDGYGYVYRGWNSTNTPQEAIDRFAYASSANGADVGDITVNAMFASSGCSGTDKGFLSGPGPVWQNYITSVNYAASITEADHGDITVARYGQPQGCQN